MSDCLKILGVKLDVNLSLIPYIREKCRVASFNLNKIRRIRKFLTIEACKSLIIALILSHLDYCNAILIGLPSKAIIPLQSIQNQSAKLILNKRKYDSSKDCLKFLHWLPVKQRIEFKVLCLVFKSLNKQAPSYFSENFKICQSNYAIRSLKNNTILKEPKCKTNFGNRAFTIAGAKLWNTLPEIIKSETVYKDF